MFPTYTGWNALADIGKAIIQRNSTLGLLGMQAEHYDQLTGQGFDKNATDYMAQEARETIDAIRSNPGDTNDPFVRNANERMLQEANQNLQAMNQYRQDNPYFNPFRQQLDLVKSGVSLDQARQSTQLMQSLQEQQEKKRKQVRVKELLLGMQGKPREQVMPMLIELATLGVNVPSHLLPAETWEDVQHPSGLWYLRNKVTGAVKVIDKPDKPQYLDLGDRIVPVVTRNGKMYDTSGKEIDPSSLTKGVSPTVAYQMENRKPPKPALSKEEKWAEDYELRQRIRDEEILRQYEEAVQSGDFDLSIEKDAKLQKAANEASARMNQYWRISSGGAYNPESTVTNRAPATNQKPKITGQQYNAMYNKLLNEHGMTDQQARLYLAENFE